MKLQDLVEAIEVVELTAKTRTEAIRSLVGVINWEAEGISADDVVQAIEEREATAQTIIAEGLALPHASIEWNGEFRIVLGRCRTGVEYGATPGVVNLVILLVVGRNREQKHLEILADIAELLNDEEFRQTLVQSRDVRALRRRLQERAGRPVARRRQPAETTRRNQLLVEHAVRLVEATSAQALLLAVDQYDDVPWQAIAAWTGRLLVVSTQLADDQSCGRADTHLYEIPHASLSRMDRANLGLLLAAANGLVDDEHDVVCVTGPRDAALDSLTIVKPSVHFRAVFPNHEARVAKRVPPAVILRVISLAIELGMEGREGQSVGAMFVVGDTRRVAQHTRQLVLNPFHGFARRLRNLLDPSLTETIKEFALLDGAFIIEADGTALSAGTYLIPNISVESLPGGLGARHQAAAAITAETEALAVTVSQSTGTVTLFQNGSTVVSLQRATPTRW